ncbi:hypothetical protein [Niabella aquatica]
MRTRVLLCIIFILGINSLVLSQTIPNINEKVLNNKKIESGSINKDVPSTENKLGYSFPEELKESANKYLKITSDIDAYGSHRLIEVCNKKIDSLNNKRDILDKTQNASNQDYLQITKELEELESLKAHLTIINSLEGKPTIWRRFFPVRSTIQAQYFYLDSDDGDRALKFIGDVGVQTNFDNLFSLKSEILSGVTKLGIPVKFLLSSTVTQDSEQEADSTAVNKLQNGGLINAGISYALFFSKNKFGLGKKHSSYFYIPLEYKFHMDNVENGKLVKDMYYYHEPSVSAMFVTDIIQKGNTDLATFFTAVKYSYFIGGSKFEEKITENNFDFLQGTVGLKIQDKFTIAFNIPLYSNVKAIKNMQSANLSLVFAP